MIRKLIIVIALSLALGAMAKAQLNPQQGHGAPSGPCVGPYVDTDTGNFYVCKTGQYSLAGGGGGITSVSLLGSCTSSNKNTQVSLNLPPPAGGLYNCNGANWVPDNPSQTFSPLAYGAKWDVKYTYAMVATSGSNTLTCPDCNFTTADQGKLAEGFASPFDSNHGTSLYAAVFAPGKICNNGFISSTSVNMCASDGVTANNAANNCTPLNAASLICTFAWGTADDTTAINNAASAAWTTGGSCGAVQLPSGAAFFSSQILAFSGTQLSLACGGQTSTGNIISGVDTNQTGAEVFGQGPNNTLLIPYNFNFTSCVDPDNAGLPACIGGTDNMEAHDFGVNGIGQSVSGGQANTKSLFGLRGSTNGGNCTGSTGFNLTLANWAVQSTSSVGLDMGLNACGDPTYTNIVVELFGGTNCKLTGAGVVLTATGLTCFGFTTNALKVLTNGNSNGAAGIVDTSGGFFGQPLNGTTSAILVQSQSVPGIWNSSGDSFYSSGPTGLSGQNLIVTQLGNTPPATINFTGDAFLMNSNNTGSNFLFNTVDKAFIHVKNSSLVWTGANNTLITEGSNSPIVYDDGGNTYKHGTGATSTISAGGFVATTGVKGICTGVATSSSTLALNITGLSTTGTGITTTCTSATLDKGIPAQGARTIENLACNSSATTVSVACTVLKNGVATAVTCTMTAVTTCTDTIHTAAAADGDLISMQIVTGVAETGANIHAVVGLN